MLPQYQFNLGGVDPLLQPNNPADYYNNIEREIERLNIIKKQMSSFDNKSQNIQKNNLWDDINNEVNSLTSEQKEILFNDETYINIERNIQVIVQQELINLVKDKISNSKEGKELLEKQLNNIRNKKNDIIKKSNEEVELFKKFQIATQANPNLTYAEFVKSIK